MTDYDFVSLEVAKKLKEKGFNEPCWSMYRSAWDDDVDVPIIYLDKKKDKPFKNKERRNKYYFAAPPLRQVIDWLMWHYDIFVGSVKTREQEWSYDWLWKYKITSYPNESECLVRFSEKYYSCEKDCVNAGILEALKTIK